MQTPQYQMDSLNALKNLPLTAPGASAQTLGAIADIDRVARPRRRVAIQHPAGDPDLRHHAGTRSRRGRGRRAEDHRRDARTACRAARSVLLMGQVQTMNSAFAGLLFGLLGAIVLIYLLIVVNFQSWSDPFVIITALPAALAGIVWMLFATGTTLSVPALTGAIMCMGVATANSVLIIQLRARAARRSSAIRSRPRSTPASCASARC